MAGSHPDLILVAKPPDKSAIPIELFIGDREHRGREGLCHRIALKPARGSRRVAIIDDADALNVEGANCLLKTLEEPPPNSVLILIVTSPSRQLPTIRSRCQLVRFDPLDEEHVAELLMEKGHASDLPQAAELARLSAGSFAAAVAQATAGANEFRTPFLQILSEGLFDSVAASRDIADHVNQAGKEAVARRQRLRELIHLAARFYRELMKLCASDVPSADAQVSQSGDVELAEAARTAQSNWSGGPQAAAAAVERCLLAELHLESNANLSTLIECWVDDLAGIPQDRTPLNVGWR